VTPPHAAPSLTRAVVLTGPTSTPELFSSFMYTPLSRSSSAFFFFMKAAQSRLGSAPTCQLQDEQQGQKQQARQGRARGAGEHRERKQPTEGWGGVRGEGKGCNARGWQQGQAASHRMRVMSGTIMCNPQPRMWLPS
jgi:hypothetical protein